MSVRSTPPGARRRVSDASRARSTPPPDLGRLPFAAAAALLPLALLALHHDLGHHGDIGFFHDWYEAFRAGPAFYRDGPGLNYPIVGVLLVCGPARLAEGLLGAPLDLATFTLLHKLVLAFGESLFVVAAASLARTLRLARPRLAALALYVLPSSWAAGAWFGQIDVWGSALLLAAAAAAIRYRRHGRARSLLAALLALHAALLTKQLTWFALPGLGLLLAAALLRHRRPAHLTFAALSPALWLLPDPFLELPPGWSSHLWWIVAGGGSDHAELVVAGGASLWSLVAEPGMASSDWRLGGLSATAIGFGAFALTLLRFLAALPRGLPSRALVLLAGLSNLAMCVLLTGVHERYLVHGAPFLMLALATAGRRAMLASAAFVVAWWGAFVLGSLHFDAFAGPLVPLRMHTPCAALLALLLAAFLVRPFARRAEAGGSGLHPAGAPGSSGLPDACGSDARPSDDRGPDARPSDARPSDDRLPDDRLSDRRDTDAPGSGAPREAAP